MELGPLQKKWLEALRSGKYEQGSSYLYNRGNYCCLGVLYEVYHGQKPPSLQSDLYQPELYGLRSTLGHGGKYRERLTALNDQGATSRMKRAAKAILAWAEDDPNEPPDYLNDGIPEDDY